MAQLDTIHRKVCDWMHPRKIGHNTTAWYDASGSFGLRYHYSNVVSYDTASQVVFVSHAGWMTKTTAERIRHGLGELGLQLLTSDLPGRWRVADRNGNAWTIRGKHIKLHLQANGYWVRHV
jgi:hypothetical protein